MAKMMGRIHERWCDCNIEQFVSGAGEKCNRRYGVKRQRSIEKRELAEQVRSEISDILLDSYGQCGVCGEIDDDACGLRC